MPGPYSAMGWGWLLHNLGNRKTFPFQCAVARMGLLGAMWPQFGGTTPSGQIKSNQVRDRGEVPAQYQLLGHPLPGPACPWAAHPPPSHALFRLSPTLFHLPPPSVTAKQGWPYFPSSTSRCQCFEASTCQQISFSLPMLVQMFFMTCLQPNWISARDLCQPTSK